jgi:endonuclease/exonuclease/phosphatase family metal-dependent hydrolase
MMGALIHRVVTYNVRRFSFGRDKVDTVEAAIARLKPLMPISLLALNEVDVALRPHALGRLADELGLQHSNFFGHVGNGKYGNAILSSSPLLPPVEHQHLDGGTVVKTPDGTEHTIVRGLLYVHTTLGGVPVSVGVTHLDHMDEAQRVTQVQHVLRVLQRPPAAPPSDAPHTPHQLLLGDMNALSKPDYSAAQWAEHEAHNRQRGWGSPADSAAAEGCLGLLRAAGFEDCVRSALAAAPSGGGATAQWRADPWSAHVHASGPRYRIDYIHSRPPPAEPRPSAPRLACVSARVENATDDGGHSSDHCPVAVDFAVVQPSAAGE